MWIGSAGRTTHFVCQPLGDKWGVLYCTNAHISWPHRLDISEPETLYSHRGICPNSVSDGHEGRQIIGDRGIAESYVVALLALVNYR